MASIVQTFVGDNALSLANEEFVRRMAWGANWKRLAIWVNLSGQWVGNIANADFYIGLCQGTTNTFKGTTDEWVGIYVAGVFGGGWNYTAGPPAAIGTGGSNPRWGYKVGASLTFVGNVSSGSYIPKTNRDWWTLFIEQTATGYLVTYRTPSAIPTVDTFGRRFEMYANGADAAPDRAVNFSTNRLLDSVSLYWTYATIGLEISEIVVVRYA
jgi:hypothetical protein